MTTQLHPPIDGSGDPTGLRTLGDATAGGNARLRWAVRGSDIIALTTAWVGSVLMVATRDDLGQKLLLAAAFVAVGVALIHHYGLYLSRVATMRTVEHTLIVRICGILFALGAIQHWIGPVETRAAVFVVATALSLPMLILGRTIYRAWLAGARAAGRFTQDVVVVGADPASHELTMNLDEHPELGLRVVGIVGSRYQAGRNGLADLWLGEADDALDLVVRSGATGAIISTNAFDNDMVNSLTQSLLNHGCHVHLNTGLTGVDQRRVRSVHVGYEPLLYVERAQRSGLQQVAKRVLDGVLATVMTIVSAPVVLVAAVLIKLEDGGPVLFRQERVGRHGTTFHVLKLRTMVVDAEAALDELRDHNERNGPLFKLEADPRVTRVGRVLRTLSIDELPQLWNVLKGEMSLVGPRPALPSEAAEFTLRLQDRTRVLPGITGLWQVEARDNPSFRAYERLDLFYVDNWSIGLDVMIIIATVESELSRVLRRLMGTEDAVEDGAIVDLRERPLELSERAGQDRAVQSSERRDPAMSAGA